MASIGNFLFLVGRFLVPMDIFIIYKLVMLAQWYRLSIFRIHKHIRDHSFISVVPR